MSRCTFTILGCLMLWLGHTTPTLGWGTLAHAVIGQLAEDRLLTHHAALRTLLTRFRHPTQYQHVHEALLGMDLLSLRARLARPANGLVLVQAATGHVTPLMSSVIMLISPSPPVISGPNTLPGWLMLY